ncbi:hypothetical protein L3073_14435 [Ancylomarina sp. DW003]|nr:hypothetical protein [Ancylomarina sp. DW003]MDE5423415.1 hypothetical protein [Ancylomarina sp. DW003]
MRKIKFILIAVMFLSGIAISCDKSDSKSNDDPGNIPGMGEAGGKLEVEKPFVLPEGVSIVGEISGFGDGVEAVEGSISLLENPTLKDAKTGYFSRGSGGQWVILDILLRNDNDTDTYFTFNRGCVFECKEKDYQHAICLRKVRFKIAKKIQKRIKLFLYCINKGRSGSKAGIGYYLRGVTKSERMMKLCNALQYKKIDVSHYDEDQMSDYEAKCKRIQDIVWAVTNGKGASANDWEFIASLQDAPEDD